MSLYLVTGGRDGCIEPLGGNADDVAAVFLSALFPVLIQQRGIVTLHAAGVATEAGGCHRAGATHQRLLSAVEQHVPPAGDGSMGQRPAHFRAVTAMARRVPAAWVVWPWHPFLMDALAGHIKAYLRDLGAARAGFTCTEEGASGD